MREMLNTQVNPPCKYYRKCGGCQLQHMSNDGQNNHKQIVVENLLGRFGKVNKIMVMDHPYEYRNKIQYSFGYDNNRRIIAGMYEQYSHNIINIEKCIIQNPIADEIIKTIKIIMKKYKMEPYDEDTGQGFLRHVLIRTGHTTGEVMVVLVTGQQMFHGKKNFVQILRKKHPEITTVISNLNDRNTSMILGERESNMYGKGYIEDVLCGMRFKISSKSFYQINPLQTEVLYKKAIDMADFKGHEKVIDAYSGIGTISLIIADQVKEVIGVEINNEGIKDAITNAKNNKIKNVFFHRADAGEFMTELAMQDEKVDVVIMDPPRAGSDDAFLSAMCKLGPEKIIYVSCNPETQARDLEYLVKNGYKVKGIQPVDLFPQTNHVETVVSLSHKKADTHININVEFGDDKGQIPIDEIARKAEEYRPSERVTYKMIQEYIESKYNFKVHTAYIAEVKRDLGLPMYDAPNAVEELKHERKHPTPEKVEAIKDALRHLEVIQ